MSDSEIPWKLVSKLDQNSENSIPPYPAPKDIITLRKHSMDYFTKDGVILRTGYDNIIYWYLLCLKELWDNAADFLTKFYKGSSKTEIITKIYRDDDIFRITVRNSNFNNIRVFQDKQSIFNYEGRSGTKQGVYVISRGLLGDAMKQLLSLGYVLLNMNDDGTRFTSTQWTYPLIIRHNGEEWHVKLFVDKVQQLGIATPECVTKDVNHTDTEIELALPIVREARNLTRARIEVFCKEYATLTTDITFKIRIVDDMLQVAPIPGGTATEKENETLDDEYDDEDREETPEEIETSLASNIISALTTPPGKAIVNLEFPALHSLSLENLNNANSIHTCYPSEFADRITNVQHKDDVVIYDILQSYREGTQLEKTKENQSTIAQLAATPDRDKQIEKYYHQLKGAIPEPAKQIILPYKKEERKNALVKRIAQLYDIDKEKAPVYRLIHGMYDDTKPRKVWIDKQNSRIEQGKGLIKFPYVFEILAIPRAEPLKGDQPGKSKQTIFIGAVNYSTSPKSNIFEGEYGIFTSEARNIISVLERCGFHRYHGPTSKLPCIIIGNLITLRPDPHGYDKSRIDIQPFADTIISACIKVASSIQTYRAAGYRFTRSTNYSTGRKRPRKGEELENLLTELLRKERGLRS